MSHCGNPCEEPGTGGKIVEAVIAGGIHFIEITMTMDEGKSGGIYLAMAAKYRKRPHCHWRVPYWIRKPQER